MFSGSWQLGGFAGAVDKNEGARKFEGFATCS
jgi:hypothetical protein